MRERYWLACCLLSLEYYEECHGAFVYNRTGDVMLASKLLMMTRFLVWTDLELQASPWYCAYRVNVMPAPVWKSLHTNHENVRTFLRENQQLLSDRPLDLDRLMAKLGQDCLTLAVTEEGPELEPVCRSMASFTTDFLANFAPRTRPMTASQSWLASTHWWMDHRDFDLIMCTLQVRTWHAFYEHYDPAVLPTQPASPAVQSKRRAYEYLRANFGKLIEAMHQFILQEFEREYELDEVWAMFPGGLTYNQLQAAASVQVLPASPKNNFWHLFPPLPSPNEDGNSHRTRATTQTANIAKNGNRSSHRTQQQSLALPIRPKTGPGPRIIPAFPMLRMERHQPLVVTAWLTVLCVVVILVVTPLALYIILRRE